MLKEHPLGADEGTWIGSYVSGVMLAGIPLIIVIPLHFSLRKKWRNEYLLYAAEKCLSNGDYFKASQYIFKLTSWGLARAHLNAAIMSVASQAEAAGDVIRSIQLRKFSSLL